MAFIREAIRRSPYFTKYIASLYDPGDAESYRLGLRATNLFGRVIDNLELKCSLPVDRAFQWAEERSPNHHKYALTRKWPVGLIGSYGLDKIENIPLINQNRELSNFDFEITSASNSSGGVKEMKHIKIAEYEYVIKENGEGERFRNLREAEEYMCKAFGSQEHYDLIGGRYVDYVTIEGFDKLTHARIILEIGNKPKPKKPRFRKVQFDIVPASAVPLLVEA